MAGKEKKIQKEHSDEKSHALSRAMRLCSGQEKCISDIQKKLKDWKVSSVFFEPIIKTLLEDGFINEERFALAFANDKYRFSKWGKIKIIYALKGKKIPDSIIQNAVKAINDKEYNLLIEKEITHKFKTIKEADRNKVKAKLYRFSQTKGFESEFSLAIINKLVKTEYFEG